MSLFRFARLLPAASLEILDFPGARYAWAQLIKTP